MEAKQADSLSIDAYFELEESSQCTFEYHNGQVFAMAGGSLNHGLICGNIFGEIRDKLRQHKSDCIALNGEVKLHIEAKNSFVHPDAMVVCGDLKVQNSQYDAVTAPVVIIEVLSKSTAGYDRGDKFFLYRQLPSLKIYILIEQDRPLIETYTKSTADLWKIERLLGLEQVLEIPVLKVSVKASEIYQNVNFD